MPDGADACRRGAAARVARAADPRLRSIVAGGYAGWTLRPDRMGRFVVPAHTSVQLVLTVEESAVRPPEFVHGAVVRHALFEGGCAPRYVLVELTPLGACRAFGIPMDHVAGELVELADVLGRASRPLGERMRAAGSWGERFDAIDRFLLGRMAVAPIVSDGVAFACQELVASGGTVPIRATCRAVGWSHKHLIAQFRQQTGLTPKRGSVDPLRARTAPDRRRPPAAELGPAGGGVRILGPGARHPRLREFAGSTPGAAIGSTRR